METLKITDKLESFINFSSELVKEELLSEKIEGLKAVEYVKNKLRDLAISFATGMRKSIDFFGGDIEKTLIANEIVKKIIK